MTTYADYGITLNSNKTQGEVDCICPKCSHTRKKTTDKCLRVNVEKKTWFCAHCGFTGGLPKETYSPPTPKVYKRPVWKNMTKLSDKVIKWFEGRKISQNTLIKMKISEELIWLPQIQGERNCIVFNYFRNEEYINYKARDGQKNFALSPSAELILYNIDSLIGAKEAFIIEGEIDTLTLIECGIQREGVAVVGVPNGANLKKNNLQYIDSCFELFDNIDKIHIGTDNDPAGRMLREDIANRFGKERCDYIEWADKKDPNEVFTSYGLDKVIECCGTKIKFPIEGAFGVSTFQEELKDLYYNGLDMGVGVGIPQFDKQIKFAKGYLTVITGVSSHGKSSFLDQVCVLLALNHNWKFAFYSPENRPTKLHLSNIIRKVIGKSWFGEKRLTEQEMNFAVKWLEGRFFFIKPEKDFTIKSIIDHAKRLKLEYDIDGIIFDSWNKFEHKMGKAAETQYISEQLDLLLNFLESSHLHGFLVAHPTKQEKDKRDPTGNNYVVPNLYSIAGSAAFFSKADNGICVYRDYNTGATKVFVQKVRFSHWGELGYTEWQYDKDSGRFNLDLAGVCQVDKSNWILAGEKQATLNIPEAKEETGTGIIINKNIGEEMPF